MTRITNIAPHPVQDVKSISDTKDMRSGCHIQIFGFFNACVGDGASKTKGPHAFPHGAPLLTFVNGDVR